MAAEKFEPTTNGTHPDALHSALHADASIDVDAALKELDVLTVLDDLDRELVGLKHVKARIRELAYFMLVDRLRHRAGLTRVAPTLHMCFTGRPGTGKTTVALKMATILHRLGYLPQGHLVVATRADLIGQYVGHTAPKTREVLKRAAGGVLFLDEAYHLYRPDSQRDYGREAIEMLLEAMENRRDELVVIFAGYKEKMHRLFEANPGLFSRIAHHIDFPNYTLPELMLIADLMLSQQGYHWDFYAQAAFEQCLRPCLSLPYFANAREVRNAIDRIKLKQAQRLVRQAGRISKQELARIDASDVRQSWTCESTIAAHDRIDEPRSRQRLSTPTGPPARVGLFSWWRRHAFL